MLLVPYVTSHNSFFFILKMRLYQSATVKMNKSSTNWNREPWLFTYGSYLWVLIYVKLSVNLKRRREHPILPSHRISRTTNVSWIHVSCFLKKLHILYAHYVSFLWKNLINYLHIKYSIYYTAFMDECDIFFHFTNGLGKSATLLKMNQSSTNLKTPKRCGNRPYMR